MNKGTVLEAEFPFTHYLSLQYRASLVFVEVHKEDLIGLKSERLIGHMIRKLGRTLFFNDATAYSYIRSVT
jgi:hypothetical protein